MYNVLKTAHIIAVIAWFGGGILMQVLALRARRSTPDKLVAFANDAAWAGNHYFAPASGLTLLFGVLAAWKGGGFSPLWVKLGLLGFFLTAVNGAAILGRLSKKMSGLAAERGSDDPGVQATARRLLTAMNIDLVIVLAVVLDMVYKPT
jgi:uncharacterized membrane protein